MHFRSDFPQPDVRQQHRILVGGLDEVWTRPDTLAPVIDDAWLAA